jgi:hypothetical protein
MCGVEMCGRGVRQAAPQFSTHPRGQRSGGLRHAPKNCW